MRRCFIVLLVVCFWGLSSAFAADLVVYSGAGLMKPMEELRTNFESKHGVTVDIHYGSSGELFGMLKMGQECDILVPGSERYTYDALHNGWIQESSIQKMVKHVPVIAVPKGNPGQIEGLQDFTRNGLKLAMGDPNSPAIGRVGRKIFKKAGIWETVKPNIDVYAPTVNQLLVYVAMEQVDGALIWGDLVTWTEAKGKSGSRFHCRTGQYHQDDSDRLDHVCQGQFLGRKIQCLYQFRVRSGDLDPVGF